MSNLPSCPACGAALPASRLHGLCPACAWKGLSESADEEKLGSRGPPLHKGSSESEGSQSSALESSKARSELMMRVPGYHVISEIARGGMGIVYRARQLEPPRTVALKMLLPHQLGSAEMAERFRLEVRALTELEHPAILPVYQVGEHDRLPYFTMKLATGGTLVERKVHFAGNWRAIAELMATLAEAVHFAHERGVLHRDLKPGNVLFDDAGRPYVSDFGLAKLAGAESDLTRSTDFLGTPNYVSPEVAAGSSGSATIASDIYSLGAVLYELLAGKPPFAAEGVPALLRKIAEEEPRAISHSRFSSSDSKKVPKDLEIICFKCLAKEPQRRYTSAHDLAEDLRRWLDGRPIQGRPATPIERVRAWARRNPVLAAMCIALSLVLGTAVVLQGQANRRLQQSLTRSLLAQAELQRSSGRAGQRFQTLALIQRATANGVSAGGGSRVKLRSEVAAALALPDMRPVSRWRVHISHFENDFDFTANLKQYAAPTADGGLGVFSTATRAPLWKARESNGTPVVELRLSPNGRWLAARYENGMAELHAIFTNTPARRWRSEMEPRAVFAFDAASEKFAISFRNPRLQHDVEVVSLEDGATQTIIPQRIPPIAITFDRSRRLLAIGAEALSVWRLGDTSQLWSVPLSHHASAVTWSADGQRIAVAMDRRLNIQGEAPLKGDPIVLFDATSGRRETVFAEATGRVEHLAFHPDGESLVAASWGGDMIWGSVKENGFRISTEGSQRALTFSADGQALGYAPTKDEIGVLDIATPTVAREWRWDGPPAEQSFTMAVSRDGNWVITGTSSGIHLWDAKARRAVAALPLPAPAWWISVLFGTDDQSVYYSAASFGVRRAELVKTNAPDGTVGLRFGSSQLLGEPKEFTATGFAADGRSLIVSQNRRQSQNERTPATMWLWPEGDPSRARKLTENFPLVGYRAVPGGKWGVSTDLIEPDLWVWNMETGERVRSLGMRLPVGSEPAANGRWLATRTREEFVVWEVGTWRPVSRWPTSQAEQVSGWVVVSPDSRLLATATIDGRITVRSMPSGGELITLIPPRPVRLSDWRFTPDSRRLYVLPIRGQVFEWNLAELRGELAKFRLDW